MENDIKTSNMNWKRKHNQVVTVLEVSMELKNYRGETSCKQVITTQEVGRITAKAYNEILEIKKNIMANITIEESKEGKITQENCILFIHDYLKEVSLIA